MRPFYFQARKEIFKIHTRDWTPKPSDMFLEELAEKCVGKFENTVSYCMGLSPKESELVAGSTRALAPCCRVRRLARRGSKES